MWQNSYLQLHKQCRIMVPGDVMASKTNAVRLVQQANIPVREIFYEYDEKDLSGQHAAKAVGLPEEQVYKTLVALTGYIRGGCSPVGMKKKYPTHFEEACQLFDLISVSAGARGHQMLLPPDQLAKLVEATYHDLII